MSRFIVPKPQKRIKPLGPTSPNVWVIEPSFGCNLKCGHCCAGLIKDSDKGMMTKAVWDAAWSLIGKLTPTVRVDIAGIVGEPTLNESLTSWLPDARRLAPLAQIQITTNGTMLRKGSVTFNGLLESGANVVYVDQYGTHAEFEKLAEQSGFQWYQYYDKPDGAPSPWAYYSPLLKLIVLQDHPAKWPRSRIKAGLLGNWYGNLNWERAKPFGMKPLEKPLTRRCNQPFQYVTVAASGDYLLCCQDGMHATAGKFGSVLEGQDGFKRFWYGHEMQTVRRRLREKDRAGTEYACRKCNITFSRCDYKLWRDHEVSVWWDGSRWERF